MFCFWWICIVNRLTVIRMCAYLVHNYVLGASDLVILNFSPRQLAQFGQVGMGRYFLQIYLFLPQSMAHTYSNYSIIGSQIAEREIPTFA